MKANFMPAGKIGGAPRFFKAGGYKTLGFSHFLSIMTSFRGSAEVCGVCHIFDKAGLSAVTKILNNRISLPQKVVVDG
ncbi:MAG: hypothetical protein IID18_04210 [Nitrospinae bacterium]|nr:hypothetical protein [Nitrospinota bacterium]